MNSLIILFTFVISDFYVSKKFFESVHILGTFHSIVLDVFWTVSLSLKRLQFQLLKFMLPASDM
jgi:hypothetical protein